MLCHFLEKAVTQCNAFLGIVSLEYFATVRVRVGNWIVTKKQRLHTVNSFEQELDTSKKSTQYEK